ncbi:PREDICTED: uncharacterized protein LOC106912825, partial [Poecilia mexicana]|uniref:uncharacterized protein LOC106912825 n=1 Tax=Poecilia mexicana TaxID=48701 RepID=UPI00072E535F
MVQMYSSNTREVTEKILIKIERIQAGNVQSPVFQQEEQTSPVSPEEEKLTKMFNDFVKVSKNNQDNLSQLLEVLVKEKLLMESERTAVLENQTTVNKASCIVEIIMEKGEEVQKETINHLQTIEPTLNPLLSAENDSELLRIRANFAELISSKTLNQLIDVLQADGVFSYSEKHKMLVEDQTLADRARNFIDCVREKGDEAWEKMLDHLSDADRTLFCNLSLSSARITQRVMIKLKSGLKKKFQSVFEGIAKAGSPTLLNQIYTELYITEG